jgi:quercetin dioxygenase-like cupin family protein
MLAGLCAALAGSTALAQTPGGMSKPMNAAAMKFGPAPPNLPKGASMIVLAGDPSKSGEFTLRLKLPKGYKIPPHNHPTDENVTVISGDFHIGMGDTFKTKGAASLTAGGFGVAPSGMNHFAWTEKGAVVQVHAMGPFQITYVNPKDDPSKK